MDLQQYLEAVRKLWWVIVVTTVLGAAYGAYNASQAVPEYRASVTFFVVTRSTDASVSAAVQGDQFAQRRVNSYVALLSTDRLAELVAEHPDVGIPAGQVARMLGASGDLDTVLFTATATSTSRDLARRVAGAVATEFVALVDEIEGQGIDEGSVHLEVVSGPSVSQVPTRPMLTTAIPAAVGFLLGLALALLLQLRDQTLRSEDQLRALGQVPVLGRIPFDRRVSANPLVAATDGSSTFAEAFRQLRTNLQFLDVQHPLQVLVVTSSLADEGKSVTSANIALSLIRTGHPTLVVEADLRRPKVADVFGVDRHTGLSDVLAGRVPVDEALVPTNDPDLVVLPSGQLPPNPAELLGSEAMHRLVEHLRSRFEVIVIDTPPLLPVTDAAVMAAHADGALLVVRSGRATRHQVEQSVRALGAVGANLAGFVMTRVQSGRSSGYDAYGRYAAPEQSRTVWARLVAALERLGSGGDPPTGTGEPPVRTPGTSRAAGHAESAAPAEAGRDAPAEASGPAAGGSARSAALDRGPASTAGPAQPGPARPDGARQRRPRGPAAGRARASAPRGPVAEAGTEPRGPVAGAGGGAAAAGNGATGSARAEQQGPPEAEVPGPAGSEAPGSTGTVAGEVPPAAAGTPEPRPDEPTAQEAPEAAEAPSPPGRGAGGVGAPWQAGRIFDRPRDER